MPGPALNRSLEPSRIPCGAAPAGGFTSEASFVRDDPEKPSRQPCTSATSAAGRPSTVTPLTPSAAPTLARMRTTGTATEPPARVAVPLQRRRIENGNQRLQVLPDDDVERNGERRLVALGLHERRPIALSQERERKGEREKRDRDGGGARAAAKRHGSETGTDALVEEPAGETDEWPEEARRHDGGRERDQTWQEQQDQAGALAVVESRLIGGTAEERGNDEAEGSESCEVERPEAALVPCRDRGGDRDDDGGGDHDGERERDAGRCEDALAEHRSRRAPPPGRPRAHRRGSRRASR